MELMMVSGLSTGCQLMGGLIVYRPTNSTLCVWPIRDCHIYFVIASDVLGTDHDIHYPKSVRPIEQRE